MLSVSLRFLAREMADRRCDSATASIRNRFCKTPYPIDTDQQTSVRIGFIDGNNPADEEEFGGK
jgi:hypothetical protein